MKKILFILFKSSCSLTWIKDFEGYKIEEKQLIIYKNNKEQKYDLDIISSINVKYEVD